MSRLRSALVVGVLAFVGTTGGNAAAVDVDNPGAMLDGGHWYVFETGNWNTAGHIFESSTASTAGPYSVKGGQLLDSRPAWSEPSETSIWAPSSIKGGDGKYYTYYAARVNNTVKSRCIGSAESIPVDGVHRPWGPFSPHDRPIACFSGSDTQPKDVIANEGAQFTLIDPTPYRLEDGSVILTYKTSWQRPNNDWHSTIRMLKLNPTQPNELVTNAGSGSNASIKIVDTVSDNQEENPSLVQNGPMVTLFTSYGLYGNGASCATRKYDTYYRQVGNGSLWNASAWLNKTRTKLNMPNGLSAPCGAGNAQVVKGENAGSWRMFFNARPGYNQDWKFYVANVKWDANDRPFANKLLHP